MSAASSISGFPVLEAYLRQLPAGLDSYADCETRGILLRSAAKEHAAHPAWESLPGVLQDVLRDPPVPTAWVSAVLTDAVFCVIADTYYPTRQAVFDWNYERTARLSHSTAYRMLTRSTTLQTFLRGIAKLHRYFQRGT